MPYRAENPGVPHVKPSWVLLLDILGFQEAVLDAERAGTTDVLLGRFRRAIDGNSQLLRTPDVPEFSALYAIRTFSDHLVLGWPYVEDGETEFGHIVLSAAQYQLGLALEGFFVRGALVQGEVYMDENTVFGAAIVEAHRLESSVAEYPRLILSERAVRIVQQHIGFYSDPWRSPQANELLVGSDGLVYLNHLRAAVPSEDEEVLESFREIFSQHRAIVVQNLERNRNNLRILSKYLWLSSLHNYTVRELYGEGSDLAIPLSLPPIDHHSIVDEERPRPLRAP